MRWADELLLVSSVLLRWVSVSFASFGRHRPPTRISPRLIVVESVISSQFTHQQIIPFNYDYGPAISHRLLLFTHQSPHLEDHEGEQKENSMKEISLEHSLPHNLRPKSQKLSSGSSSSGPYLIMANNTTGKQPASQLVAPPRLSNRHYGCAYVYCRNALNYYYGNMTAIRLMIANNWNIYTVVELSWWGWVGEGEGEIIECQLPRQGKTNGGWICSDMAAYRVTIHSSSSVTRWWWRRLSLLDSL